MSRDIDCFFWQPCKTAAKVGLEGLEHKFQSMRWKHTAGIIVTVIVSQLALAGLLLRFLR